MNEKKGKKRGKIYTGKPNEYVFVWKEKRNFAISYKAWLFEKEKDVIYKLILKFRKSDATDLYSLQAEE